MQLDFFSLSQAGWWFTLAITIIVWMLVSNNHFPVEPTIIPHLSIKNEYLCIDHTGYIKYYFQIFQVESLCELAKVRPR